MSVLSPSPSASTPAAHKSLQVWMDGKLVPKENATVSVFDHGLLYGDGVFEGIRIYNGRIYESAAHLERFYESAKAIRLDIPITPQQWEDAIYATAKANNFTDCYVRAVVTRGVGKLGISPVNCERPTCFVICDVLEMYPKAIYENGMPVITASTLRNSPMSLSPRIKSLNYLNNILGKIEALDAGVPEAIMLNANGNVSEGTAMNLFAVKRGIATTPPLTDGILEGVTRNTVLRLLPQSGVTAREASLQKHDLYIADELFVCGTGAEVVPVTTVDKRAIGNGSVGPVTKKIMDIYARHVRSGR